MKKYSDYAHSSISMSKDSLFKETLNKLFTEYKIDTIVECGTYLGLGSTSLLAEAILKNATHYPDFITIEVDKKIYNEAVKNLKKYPFITPKWGLSVNAAEAKKFIQTDDAILHHENYPDVFIDYTDNPAEKYIEEIDGNLSKNFNKKESVFEKLTRLLTLKSKVLFEENILETISQSLNGKTPLFLLDSAGGIGYFEFLTVARLMKNKPHFIILDDIHHLKHFRSFRDLSNDTDNYTIINKSLENGWVVAKYKNS